MNFLSPTRQSLSVFPNESEPDQNTQRPVRASLSDADHRVASRHSLKVQNKERYYQPPPPRSRGLSASEESPGDVVPELKPILTTVNKNIKRGQEQPTATPDLRRSSTPQLHFSALFPNTFRTNRSPTNHTLPSKTNAKEETHRANSNGNVLANTNSSQGADRLTTKIDIPFSLKSPAMSDTQTSRPILPPTAVDRVSSSSSDDSTPVSAFVLEEGSREARSAELFICESHAPLCLSKIYREHFFNYFHTNYYGDSLHAGPFIASVRFVHRNEGLHDISEVRTIIRTANRNFDLTEVIDESNEYNAIAILFHRAELIGIDDFGAIGDPKTNERLYTFDKADDERHNCKIGVIFQRATQLEDYDILCNDGLSDPMVNFLAQISTRVNLKGFDKYRADLDIKSGLHGEYSYYTEYENHEIMFNVAPLIPTTKSDGQFIQRKGLVANAFVCIVFQEPGAIFMPDRIAGRVTQIFITVQPMHINQQLYYKVSLWRRNEIKAVIDPPLGVFRADQSFRSYFLTLILNAVAGATESPNLRKQIVEPRRISRLEELKKLILTLCLSPIDEFNTQVDESKTPIQPRPNVRSESFASGSTAATHDSAIGTADHTSPTSTKKRGFSKRLLGVFSGRSGSITSTTMPANPSNSDGVSAHPSLTPDSAGTAGWIRDLAKRSKSPRPQAPPLIPVRAAPPPVTPTSNLDNPAPETLVNTAALAFSPRSRSNSSPDDAAHTNQTQWFDAPTSDEVRQNFTSSSASDDDDDEEEETSSSEEQPAPRQLAHSLSVKTQL